MSLNNVEEEYEMPKKRKQRINKIPIIIFLVGTILGILLGFYMEPIFDQNEEYETCIKEKELLNMENTCFYLEVENAKEIINACIQNKPIDNNTTP